MSKHPAVPSATVVAESVSPLAAALAAAKAADPVRFARVVRVTALTMDERPARVVLVCSEDGCGEERECATQDLFQVHRCVKHQLAAIKQARRGRAKRRTQSLKAQVAELQARLAALTTEPEQDEPTDDSAE